MSEQWLATRNYITGLMEGKGYSADEIVAWFQSRSPDDSPQELVSQAQKMGVRRESSVLWDVARAQRSFNEEGTGAVVVLSRETLDQIDELTGYDEMGQ